MLSESERVALRHAIREQTGLRRDRMRIVEFKCEKCGRYDYGLGAKDISCGGHVVERNGQRINGHDYKWMKKTGRIFDSWGAVPAEGREEKVT